jgi:2-phospho-L-lactate guanylyltransferase
VATVVVPFRAGKSRLALADGERRALALAMLEAVVAACVAFDETLVVTSDADAATLAERHGARPVADPGGGQAAAVAAGLAASGPGTTLVVNADLPRATPDDLHTLAAAAPALVAARDGTTNALALLDAGAFRPLYGPGSARRFAALGLRPLDLPNLVEDVDTVADAERLGLPASLLA